MENALLATLLFFKSKHCQLSYICWLQLSQCHLERKVNPRWFNTQSSNVNTAHVAGYRNIRLMHLFNTVGGESENSGLTAVHLKSSSALKKKHKTKQTKKKTSRKRISIFSSSRIINCILGIKNCNKAWCFLECPKPYQDVQISSFILIMVIVPCP